MGKVVAVSIRLDEELLDRAKVEAIVRGVTLGERVSISNSQRNMVDRLKLGEFEARTIEFYSIGYSQNLPVVIDGQIKLEILSGDPFPIMLTLIFVGFGAATYLTLRRLKSRKDWYAR